MRLEGHIPSDLSRLARLKILFLFNNRPTGSIPAGHRAHRAPRVYPSNNCSSSRRSTALYASELYLRKLPKCRVLGTDDLELVKIRRRRRAVGDRTPTGPRARVPVPKTIKILHAPPTRRHPLSPPRAPFPAPPRGLPAIVVGEPRAAEAGVGAAHGLGAHRRDRRDVPLPPGRP